MAMVIAVRGSDRFKMSRQTYENVYKRMGFRLEKTKHEDVGEVPEEVDNGVSDVPISEMTKEQLKEFADMHNIDTSSATNLKEARRIVRDAIRKSRI